MYFPGYFELVFSTLVASVRRNDFDLTCGTYSSVSSVQVANTRNARVKSFKRLEDFMLEIVVDKNLTSLWEKLMKVNKIDGLLASSLC